MSDLNLRVSLTALDNATGPMRRAQEAARGLAGGMDAVTKKLVAMQGQQAAIGKLRTLQTSLKGTSNDLAVAKQRFDQLDRATKAGNLPQGTAAMKAHTKALRDAQKEVEKLTAKRRSEMDQLNRLRSSLNTAGITNLTQAEAALRTNIDRTTNAIKRQTQARAQAAKMAKTAAVLGGSGVAMRMAGQQAARPVGRVLGAYAEQENATSNLRSSMMLADGSVMTEFAQMEALAKRLGDRLPGTTADFVEMFTMLRRQGLSAQSVLGGTGEAAAYLGVQLRMPVTEAAEFAAKMQDATRTTEGDMMRLMDTIQRTYYLGVDSDNMLQGFTKMAPVLSILRKDGLEAANALAPMLVMFDQAGMKGEASGNALRKVMQGAMDAKKIAKGNEMLAPKQRLNFTDGKGEFGGFEKMFAELQKLKGLTTEKRVGVMKAMFGDDAETMQVLSILMDKGLAGYNEAAAKMTAQADLQKRVNDQLGTLSNLWEAAQGTFTNVLASVGETVAPQAKAITTWLSEAGAKMGEFVRNNQGMVRIVVIGIAAFAALATGLGTTAIALAALLAPMAAARFVLARMGIMLPTIGTLLRAVGGGIMSLAGIAGRAMLFIGRGAMLFMATPLGAALTLMGIAIGMWVSRWDGIKGGASALWTDVKAIFSAGLAYLQSMPQRMWQAGSDMVSGLIRGVQGKLGELRSTIVGAAENAAGWFKSKLGINSPSRVFMELGGWVSEGAAMGIAGKAPMVARAAAAMAALPGLAAAPALAAGVVTSVPAIGAAAPAQTAPASISITVNAAPGQDPQAIARAVAAELDRRERQRGARAMSALTDR